MKYKCPVCNHMIIVNYPKIIHAGLSECGFMYCDKSGDIVTWSSYDKTYEGLVSEKHPWALNKLEQALIEGSLMDCPCGGKLTFAAHPRCPKCNAELPDILPDNIHWVQLKNLFNGEKENIWKTQ